MFSFVKLWPLRSDIGSFSLRDRVKVGVYDGEVRSELEVKLLTSYKPTYIENSASNMPKKLFRFWLKGVFLGGRFDWDINHLVLDRPTYQI